MEAKQESHPPGAERKVYREDMEDSYGVAYSTRSSDEGYGQGYGEAVKKYQTSRDKKELQREATAERDEKAAAFGGKKNEEEYDISQGHPVAQKEEARHSKHEDAFEHKSVKNKGKTGASTRSSE